MMPRRLFSLFQRRRLDAELEAELLHHLEALEAEYKARGLSTEEARLAAKRDMGGITQTKEAYRAQRGMPVLETVARDIRFGLRTLWRTPWVTAAVTATLAIGIGANAAIFAVVYGVLLKPLPYPEPEALVAIAHRMSGSESGSEIPSAPYLYFTYREDNRTLTAVGLWRTGTANVTGLDRPEQVQALVVTHEVLPILGVPPLLGRGFSSQDDSPGSPTSVILTHGYWQRRFGADDSVVGKRLVVDGQPRDVIGILPRRFRFLDREIDVVFPFQLDRSQVTLGRYTFQCLARLRGGITVADASADLARLVPLAIERFPPPPGYTSAQFKSHPVTPRLRPLKQEVVGDLGKMLGLLMGALGLVLLIAGANVANLLLVRADGRQRELAVRAALGAGWGRIATGFLIESVLLGLMGGILGLAVADAGLRLLPAFGPTNLPRLREISIDPLVLLFTLTISLLAGGFSGLLPVMKYANPRLATTLGSGGRSMSDGRERHRARASLVVMQVAMALVLLVCCGLMMRTVQALSDVQPGFAHPEQVEMMHVDAALADNIEETTRVQHSLVDRIAAIPGVASVAFADIAPLGANSGNDTVLTTEGKTYADGQPRPLRRFEFISPAFFHTLGTPLIAGRDVTWVDLYEKRMVALASESLAREDWGSAAEALHKRVRASPTDPWREIVGVVGDLRDNGMNQPPPAIVYFPALMDHFWGAPTIGFGSVTFLIRSPRAGSESLLREIQRAVWDVNANLPIAETRTLGDVYRRSLARTSFTLAMLAIAGVMGLTLGFVGLYGVIAYGVSQRTREIGIRLALGAQTTELKRMFVRHGVVLAVAGILVGLTAAAALTRFMSSLLFGVSPLDPLTYAATTTVVLVVAMLAAYLPARRATRTNPIEALRCG
jgi:putative ABC transport system permease protein